jgi:hypothetical protein
MDRTLDRVIGMGVYTPRPTILVVDANVVPAWAIGRASRWPLRHRPILESSWFGSTRFLGVAHEVDIELGELQLDGIDGGVDCRLPLDEGLVERLHRGLQDRDAAVAPLLLLLNHQEPLVDNVGVGYEPLLDLLMDLLQAVIDEELHVGFYHTKSLLTARVVVVIQIGRMNYVSNTRLLAAINRKKRGEGVREEQAEAAEEYLELSNVCYNILIVTLSLSLSLSRYLPIRQIASLDQWRVIQLGLPSSCSLWAGNPLAGP